jgi:xanthine dehydrogenase molybdenum-binding subunit
LGADPIELRLQNTVRPGDELLPLFPGVIVSSVEIEKCLREGAARIGWERRGAPGADPGPIKRGLGFALSTHTAGHLTPSTAQVELASNGKIILKTALPDIGSENPTALRQMAAETLNLDVDGVESQWADTTLTAEDFGIHASRGVFQIGRCVTLAARELEGQLRELAAEVLDASPEELVLGLGRYTVAGDAGRAVTLAELASAAADTERMLVGTGTVEENNSAWGFAAHFAEVEVDTDTGAVAVTKMVAAVDVGRAINPTIVEGQLEGAAVQGIGYALSEELIHDPLIRGTTLNANLLAYEVPSIRDVPLVEPLIVDSYEPLHPYGAKGCGEIGLVGVVPAIANAVYNALGIRFPEIPMSPPRVLEALARARTGTP